MIACWDAKFHFNFWRPVAAIASAAADGDDRTGPDPLWEPLAVTPDFPEYPSGHACVTAAVAHTSEDFFDKGVPIPARNVVTGEERVCRSADAVVDEDGAEMGRGIARRIRDGFLAPRR